MQSTAKPYSTAEIGQLQLGSVQHTNYILNCIYEPVETSNCVKMLETVKTIVVGSRQFAIIHNLLSLHEMLWFFPNEVIKNMIINYEIDQVGMHAVCKLS